MQRPLFSPWLIWLLIALSLSSLAATQWMYDQEAGPNSKAIKRARITSEEPLIPSLTALKLLSFGNPSVAADILWLQTIQYFGSGTPYGEYRSLGPLLKSITQLDPKFAYPYEFGMIVLPFMKQTDTAIELGLQAQKELPNNGLLTYFLATDYHLNKKDYKNAARYYQLAATQPGAPSAARVLAASALSKQNDNLNDRLVAAEFWKTIYETSESEDQKQVAKDWYQHMQIIYTIEKAAQEYKAKFNRFPGSQDELVKTGFLDQVYTSPVNRQLILNPSTGIIDFDKPIEDL